MKTREIETKWLWREEQSSDFSRAVSHQAHLGHLGLFASMGVYGAGLEDDEVSLVCALECVALCVLVVWNVRNCIATSLHRD